MWVVRAGQKAIYFNDYIEKRRIFIPWDGYKCDLSKLDNLGDYRKLVLKEKLNYITPALINRGWKNKITMETKVQFTDGKINLRGNLFMRSAPKKADYVLYLNANNPIAIVEAKDNNHSVSFGMQQAKEYAKMLDVPFAFSSNGPTRDPAQMPLTMRLQMYPL